MISNRVVTLNEVTDAELVARSVAGDREAFNRTVARYQTLICSLAYSRIGNLGQSQDIAQETFITAWKHLRLLREPARLRAWLCGIVRNRIYKTLRREGREPASDAESLDTLPESAAREPLPSEHAIRQEEAAILWRSLERIPELYREPLILFYREQHSIEAVAAELDLSQDAVKQRLSRGRKLLHEEVLAFVESALERTNPGKAFTIAVLATLPVLSGSAQAATIGAAAAKGSALAKGASLLGIFSALIGPLLGFLVPWFQYRAFLAAAKTESHRKYIQTFYRRLFSIMFGFAALLVLLIAFGRPLVHAHPLLFSAALIVLVAAYIVAAAWMGAWAHRMFRELRAAVSTQPREKQQQSGWEY